jgi:hypothetical protein
MIANDEAMNIVKEIMSKKVPTQSSLANPFKNTRSSSKRKDRGDSVESWSARDFVDYFSDIYSHSIGGKYLRTYSSDGAVFSEIMNFMSSNGLQKSIWTKKFIDWCFDNVDYIRKNTDYVYPQNIRPFVNKFYQDMVIPEVEEETIERIHFETTILEDIKQADAEGKASEIFVRFGIPVAATYFICYKNFKPDVVESGLRNLIEKYMSSDVESKSKILQMFYRSVIKSPYPLGFEMLDWRERFKEYCEKYHEDTWWRNKDYNGKYLSEYDKILRKHE